MRYEPAAKQPTAKACQPGTLALGQALEVVWRDFISMRGAYGCWNPRRIEGSSSWSLHAEGRAIDVGVPAALHQSGWECACILVDQRKKLGTMRVFWDGHMWSTEKRTQWTPISPRLNQHRDHIHVEQFWADAKREHDLALAQYIATLGAALDAIPREVE